MVASRQGAYFVESALVEEQVNSLTGSQPSPGMLPGDLFFATQEGEHPLGVGCGLLGDDQVELEEVKLKHARP